MPQSGIEIKPGGVSPGFRTTDSGMRPEGAQEHGRPGTEISSAPSGRTPMMFLHPGLTPLAVFCRRFAAILPDGVCNPVRR